MSTEYITNDTDLKSVADAIRAKTGKTDPLTFPAEFASEIAGIETGGGSDISLGLTGAAVGQIAKITAVDENGVPTAWEPVDMPSGGSGGDETWELIRRETVPTGTTKLVITKDENDNSFAYDELRFVMQCAIPSDKKDTVMWVSFNNKTNSNASVSINGATSNQIAIGYGTSLGGYTGIRFGAKGDMSIDGYSYLFSDTPVIEKLTKFQIYTGKANIFIPEGSKLSLFGKGK